MTEKEIRDFINNLSDTMYQEGYQAGFTKAMDKKARIYVDQGEWEQAEYFVHVLKEIGRLFELWDYTVGGSRFQIAVSRKKEEDAVSALKEMLASIEKGWDMENFRLYRHIKRKDGKDAGKYIIPGIINELKKDPEFNFLKKNKEFIRIIHQYEA